MMAGEANFGAAGWMSLGGTFLQIMAQREAGRIARIRGEQARVSAEFDAFEAERRGGAAIAISERQALEEERQGRLLASRALAVAAASGAGVSDPTMVRVIANAHGEAAYRASVALYEGEAKDRQLRTEAAMGRLSGWEAQAEGAARQEGAVLGMLGTAAKAGATLYDRYGRGGPDRGDSALISEAVPGQFSLANPAYG
jgi:hypothetical protein